MRWACSDDLQNYFRIKDLLGGLTEAQQKQLRENIGISISEGGQQTPDEITYNELLSKIKGNLLVTGARYIIKDFQTIYETTEGVRGLTEFPSEIWPLLVTAIDSNKLDPRVVITTQPEYQVEYNPTKEVLSDGTTTKGKITFLKDQYNNQAYYDFKNMLFPRTYEKAGLKVSKDLYTFSIITEDSVQDASLTGLAHDNKFAENCINNVFVGETYYTILEPDCYNNTFLSGCHDVLLKWESVNNLFYEVVVDLTGTIAGKTVPQGQDILSSTVTKYVHNVNETTVLVHFDPDTFAQQITLIPDVYSQTISSGTTWNS